MVADALDSPVTFAAGAGPDTRDYRVDFTRAHDLLPGFEPRWTIAAGIDQLARDMHAHGLSSEDFEGPRYVRLLKVRELTQAGRLDDDLRMRAGPVGAAAGSADRA